MINLISTQASTRCVSGPWKVFRNLVRGLDEIGYPYVINRALGSSRRLWIHDDAAALRYLPTTGDVAVVVGPNLFTLPREIPGRIDLQGCLYVHPSDWPIQLWGLDGFTQCPMAAWPVGIDLGELSPLAITQRAGILVYHKDRPTSELDEMVDMLRGEGHDVGVIRYREYDERELHQRASKAQVVVWHGSHESQGIALEETLALDAPIVLLDANRLSDAVSPYRFPSEYGNVCVTSAPYWDRRCGVRIERPEQVAEAVEYVLAHRSEFAPREFVRERLSLAGQARKFVELWDHFGMSYEDGLHETLRNARRWREPVGDRASRFAGRVRRAVGRRIGGRR